MGFRLLGGRPKNMKQGIYWTQRHLADVRAEERREVAQSKQVQRQQEKAIAFNDRYRRIVNGIKGYHIDRQDVETKATPSKAKAIKEKMESFNEILQWIEQNIESADNSDLTKLANVGRGLIVALAKARSERASYNPNTKQLVLEDRSIDFS